MRRDELMEYVIVLPRISFWISEWELDCFWRETDAGEEVSRPIYTRNKVGLCVHSRSTWSWSNDRLETERRKWAYLETEIVREFYNHQ